MFSSLGGLSNNPSLASLSISPSPHASPKGAGFMRASRAQEKARKNQSGLVGDTLCSDSSVSSLDSSMKVSSHVYGCVGKASKAWSRTMCLGSVNLSC